MEGVGDLQDAIQRELAWRKVEITAARGTAALTDEAAKYIFRGVQVLLCAHWEGFLKAATKLYLEHVFAQNVTVRELSPRFIAIKYFAEVMNAATAKYPGSDLEHVRLAQEIRDTFDGRVSSPGWKVDTEGNPSSEVLERILRSIDLPPQLGMDNATWAATKIFVNEHLLRDRNYVAHGDGLPIGKQSILGRAEKLLLLLDLVSEKLLDAAGKRTYLAVPF